MRRRLGLCLPAFLAVVAAPRTLAAQAAGGTDSIIARYRATADRIIRAAQADSAAWLRLAELTDRFGNRLSGSTSLERAIDWVLAEMRRDGLDSVRGEPVMVPHWVRGSESLELVEPRRTRLPVLGLGGSVGTPRDGITASVLVVHDTTELQARAAEARGKIVLFDAPYVSYGETVQYRWSGAIWAAHVGAVAALLRSVSPFEMRQPHTGVTHYDSTARPVPFAAVSIEDAMMLHRMQARGQPVVVTLTMEARTLPDAPSRNAVAELVGAEHPEQVVVMGGHIDSWDVGTGAMDDGGGVVVAWEALRLLKRLGLRPRRTVRVVAWTNEENGARGGSAYRDAHAAELAGHVAAIESDGGVFRPLGFGFTGSDSALAVVTGIGRLLAGIGAGAISRGGGGTDIEAIMERGVPGLGLNDDGTRYFWYHHSDADTVDKLDPGDMSRCVAAMAVMAYVLADLPEQLPRGAPPAAGR
jgi:carboxypeptidase Q